MSAAPGDLERFYQEVALKYEGNGCLVWPYSKGGKGYAQMYVAGRKVYVHRRLCEEVNGPPPADGCDAAHSCGLGHAGCVTKRHLSWKTRAENLQDRVGHGTDQRGVRAPLAVLSEDQAREIFHSKGKDTQRALAEKFGVTKSNISAIQRGKSWKHIDMGSANP